MIDQELLTACVINPWSITPRMMLIDSMIESGCEEVKAMEAFEPPTASHCLPSIYGSGVGEGTGIGDGRGGGRGCDRGCGSGIGRGRGVGTGGGSSHKIGIGNGFRMSRGMILEQQ